MTPGEPSQVWEWTSYGEERDQFMASEGDFADYIAAVLPRLVEDALAGRPLVVTQVASRRPRPEADLGDAEQAVQQSALRVDVLDAAIVDRPLRAKEQALVDNETAGREAVAIHPLVPQGGRDRRHDDHEGEP